MDETNTLNTETNLKDISELKEIATLQESGKAFKIIVENAQDGIIVVGIENKRFAILNKAICRMLGYSKEEFKNLSFKDIHPTESLPYVIEQFKSQIKKEGLAKDIPMKRKDGSVFYADVNSSMVVLGKRKHLAGIFRDVTMRKKAEDEIEKLAKFTEENLNPIYQVSKEGILLYANPASRKLILEDQTKIGDKVPKKWMRIIKTVYDSGQKQQVELELSGKVFLFDLFPVIKGGYVNSCAVDITRRKQVEKALEKSEEETRKDKLVLEQKNLALKELIEHMERAKNTIREDIAINMDQFVTPLLKKLEIKGISRKYAKLLRRHLEELTSLFGRNITKKSANLSPREIELCGMIKGGLSSKEISKLLNVSYKTIDKHRRNIRKKLGISKKKLNLTSFLQKI